MLVNTKHHKRLLSARCSGEGIRIVKSVFIQPAFISGLSWLLTGSRYGLHSGWSWIIGHLWRDRRAQGPGAMKQS